MSIGSITKQFEAGWRDGSLQGRHAKSHEANYTKAFITKLQVLGLLVHMAGSVGYSCSCLVRVTGQESK
jgi:hypothetical protein